MKNKVMCPICNDPHFRNTGYVSVEAFVTHMTREHNWATHQAMKHYAENKRDEMPNL